MSRVKIATRRDFLAGGLGLVGIGATLPNFLVNSARAAPQEPANDRVIVALLLSGGHDGVSDVVPYAHDEYHKVRPTIRYTEEQVLKLNDEVGLHPNLTGLKELYDEGSLSVVLGTGYPNFNYSHFTGRNIWETANPEIRRDRGSSTNDPGWLGRYFDHAFKGVVDPTLGVAVGNGRAPITIRGVEHSGLSFNSPSSFSFTGDRSEQGMALYNKLNELDQDTATGELQFVTRTVVGANSSAERIRAVASNYKPKVDYPNTGLARALRTIAGMINGNMSTRAYYASIDGFDTHSGQKARFDSLMNQFNGAVTAFYQDLAAHGTDGRVLTFTFSEFGRRVKENNSRGTDHGAAQPVLLIGPGVKVGVYGSQPPFDADTTKSDNFKMQLDFRCVYSSILEKWLGCPSEPVLGGKYAPVDCIG